MITILHIEDNKDIGDNTAELLELEGYLFISANNGAEGILLAELHQPDLIISDMITVNYLNASKRRLKEIITTNS